MKKENKYIKKTPDGSIKDRWANWPNGKYRNQNELMADWPNGYPLEPNF